MFKIYPRGCGHADGAFPICLSRGKVYTLFQFPARNRAVIIVCSDQIPYPKKAIYSDQRDVSETRNSARDSHLTFLESELLYCVPRFRFE